MDYPKKEKTTSSEKQTVRMTITSRNPKAVENVTMGFLKRANEENVEVRGPVRLPTRTLRITTRKTPCGNGTNTWDTFELKIYKRMIELQAPAEQARKIANFDVEAGVDVSIVLPGTD